ncbi:MAG: hypothetical protein ACYTGX_14995 [Planctomycetota bacterium]|jgi:hypothetical protein
MKPAFLVLSLTLLTLATPTQAPAQDAEAAKADRLQLRVFDVRDLLAEPRDFPAPALGTIRPAQAAGSGRTPATAPRAASQEALERLAQQVRSLPDLAWPEHAGVEAKPGTLVVRQSATALERIEAFLVEQRRKLGRLMAVSARFLTVPETAVRNLTDGLHIISAERAQVMLALAKTDPAYSVVAAPRVTAFDGQRAHITIGNQISFVQRFEVTASRAAVVADPVVATLTTGLALELRGRARADGWVDVDLGLQAAELLRPIPELRTRFGTVQVPDVVKQRLAVRGSLPPRSWAMVVGFTRIAPDGTKGAPVIVLAQFRRVSGD